MIKPVPGEPDIFRYKRATDNAKKFDAEAAELSKSGKVIGIILQLTQKDHAGYPASQWKKDLENYFANAKLKSVVLVMEAPGVSQAVFFVNGSIVEVESLRTLDEAKMKKVINAQRDVKYAADESKPKSP